ncbi:uncharacterized protein LOC119596629 [Penaeus monodon]|uniref:uncharacterized protein LOC119596629 n=1 Tax=Penaeus monodon TaxID=6687 RepID=UPI0018A6FF0C|nr:uncharacterized protein LOC119596629 [Penaeus monodon]
MPAIVRPVNGSLPARTRQSVLSGNLQEVRAWLSEAEGDVNAADQLGFPLLYTACATGHRDIVKELLQHYDLHLNSRHTGSEKYVVGRDCRDLTPLCIAAFNGHEDCVELLLKASLPCQIDTSAWPRHSGTAIMSACDNNHWNIVSLIFRHQRRLSLKELDHILPKARANNRLALVFSILYELFSKSVVRREWSQATSLLKRLREDVSLCVPLAEAVISRNAGEVRSLLRKESQQPLDGVLLATAVEGSSEDVLELLLNHVSYAEDTLGHALLLTSLNNNLEILPALLRQFFGGYKYATLSQARRIAEEAHYRDAERLLANALEASAHACIQRDSRNVSPAASPSPPGLSSQVWLVPPRVASGAGAPVSLDDACYRTDTSPRGLVLILNYKDFDGKPDLLREGSDLDVRNLQDTFGQMGYATQVHCNLTEDQTMLNVINFRDHERLRTCGSVVVVVMSHGVARQTFHTSDMQVFTVDKLLKLFSDRECPRLKGKAKVFLFNFCRGTDVSRMVYQTDAVRTAHNDMLCVYSAQEGFVSLRHPVLGTPFVRTWCQVLANNAYNTNMYRLLQKFMKQYSETAEGVSVEIQNLNFNKEFWFMPQQTQAQQAQQTQKPPA